MAFPLRDLIRVHVELLGQLAERPLTLNGSQRTLALKADESLRRLRRLNAPWPCLTIVEQMFT